MARAQRTVAHVKLYLRASKSLKVHFIKDSHDYSKNQRLVGWGEKEGSTGGSREVEGTRIASLRFRYDSPDIYVHRGIKSSWSSRVYPSRALLMDSMSTRKQREKEGESCWGGGDKKVGGKSPRKWSRYLRYIRTAPSWMERVESTGILMGTVGRRVEFEWQLIKGSPPNSHVSEASLSCQCGPPGPTDSPIKAESGQYR